MLSFKTTTDILSSVYYDSLQIRKSVFINEQHVDPKIEIDDKEKFCIHIVLYNEKRPVATARLLPLKDGQYKIQRVAVLQEERGKHYGNLLMKELEQTALQHGASSIILGAQNHALAFYEKLGYNIYGDEYIEANIAHSDMIKRFS